MPRSLILPIIALGLYSQANNICLANNTSILIILYLLLQGQNGGGIFPLAENTVCRPVPFC